VALVAKELEVGKIMRAAICALNDMIYLGAATPLAALAGVVVAPMNGLYPRSPIRGEIGNDGNIRPTATVRGYGTRLKVSAALRAPLRGSRH